MKQFPQCENCIGCGYCVYCEEADNFVARKPGGIVVQAITIDVFYDLCGPEDLGSNPVVQIIPGTFRCNTAFSEGMHEIVFDADTVGVRVELPAHLICKVDPWDLHAHGDGSYYLSTRLKNTSIVLGTDTFKLTAEPEVKERPHCVRCEGSDQISVDATATWDVNAQEWVLAGVLDSYWCSNCEDVFKHVDWK